MVACGKGEPTSRLVGLRVTDQDIRQKWHPGFVHRGPYCKFLCEKILVLIAHSDKDLPMFFSLS